MRLERCTGPVTIADLIRVGKLLEIGCLGCGQHVYVDAAGVGLPGNLTDPEAASRLACSGCGAINQRITEEAFSLSHAENRLLNRR